MHEPAHLVVTTTEALRDLIRAEVRAELAGLRRDIAGVTMTPRPEWVPIAEFATMARCSIRTVRRMIDKGEVDSRRVGRTTLIRLR